MSRKLILVSAAAFAIIGGTLVVSTPAQAHFGFYIGLGYPWLAFGNPYYDHYHPYDDPYLHSHLRYGNVYYPEDEVECYSERILVTIHHHRHWRWRHICH